MFRPAFSPDLNLIESLWNKIRDHIRMIFREEAWDPNGQEKKRPISLERLSEMSQLAWERINPN